MQDGFIGEGLQRHPLLSAKFASTKANQL